MPLSHRQQSSVAKPAVPLMKQVYKIKHIRRQDLHWQGQCWERPIHGQPLNEPGVNADFGNTFQDHIERLHPAKGDSLESDSELEAELSAKEVDDDPSSIDPMTPNGLDTIRWPKPSTDD